jgi:hypothetical protein
MNNSRKVPAFFPVHYHRYLPGLLWQVHSAAGYNHRNVADNGLDGSDSVNDPAGTSFHQDRLRRLPLREITIAATVITTAPIQQQLSSSSTVNIRHVGPCAPRGSVRFGPPGRRKQCTCTVLKPRTCLLPRSVLLRLSLPRLDIISPWDQNAPCHTQRTRRTLQATTLCHCTAQEGQVPRHGP